MHELSVVFEIIKAVDKVAIENHLTFVESIVVEVGEVSTIVPHYLQECFPAAIDNTPYADTKLIIEVIKGVGKCRHCGTVYDILPNEGFCPTCKTKDWECLSGREFNIKEIVAY